MRVPPAPIVSATPMATRTIVTSQPDVACDVCARRLLRGEQPDVFVAAGRRRTVCELCAPRAVHEGWLRETEDQSISLPPTRPRRGGGLFERLPVPFRVRRDTVSRTPAPALPAPAPAAPAPVLATPVAGNVHVEMTGGASVQAPAEVLVHAPAADVSLELPPDIPAELATVAPQHEPAAEQLETGDPYAQSSPYLPEAIAVFNSSEFPRRVAGVIRSLGAPLVTVRSAEHLASVVRIVVAWELSWYCYEVDLSEPVAEAQVIAQGTELAELAREDRIGNAAAADSGSLLLGAGA
jgi:hypothetical protein